MAFHDRNWFIAALETASKQVGDLQDRIQAHIKADEFDAARQLLPSLDSALSQANNIANQFADKFGG